MKTKRISKEEKLKQEVRAWKETCEIVRDEKIMKDIQKSLKQITQGRRIPLAQL